MLTSAGSVVARFAASLEQEISDFVADLSPALPAKPLVLAAGEGAHLYLLANAVRRLLAVGDNVRLVTANTEETIEAVRSGNADVGVAVVSRRSKDFEYASVGTYPQVLVMPAGHRLARHRSLSVTDLEGVALVVPPRDRPHRRALDRALRRAHVRWSIAIETEGWAQMLHFVSLGVGLAIVNGCIVPGADLVARPIDDLPTVTYSAVFRRGSRRDPRVGAMLDVIRTSAP